MKLSEKALKALKALDAAGGKFHGMGGWANGNVENGLYRKNLVRYVKVPEPGRPLAGYSEITDEGRKALVDAERGPLEKLAWSRTHRDFKGVGADGVKRVLYLNPKTGGTESWPLSALPIEELRYKAGVGPRP